MPILPAWQAIGARYAPPADANKRFLADYAARPDVKKLPDGLMYRVLKSGDGPPVKNDSDLVTVYYKGVVDQRQSLRPDQGTGRTGAVSRPARLYFGARGSGSVED